jgi:NAD(P)-dependent dehydrogenase (short-subunit alcohol dehydrogenase family)
MMEDGSVVVIGGSSGLGREIAASYAGQGRDVVITGRDAHKADAVAREIGGSTTAVTFDLARPNEIAAALAGLGPVRYLVLCAIDRDQNSVRDYDIAKATELVTLKLVGYTEVIHALLDRLDAESSIVLFGGLARERPYPGSMTVSTVNGGIVGMVRAMATELAPIRVNGLHPGIVGDSPYWEGKTLDHVVARTPTKRLVQMTDIVDATRFLLENRSVNAQDLRVDGGTLIL